MMSRREKRREKVDWRKEEDRRQKKRLAMPDNKAPKGVVLLEHGAGEAVWCIVPLPGGDRVATASNKGKVRVFAVASGALECEIYAHKGTVGRRALAALGGDIIVSGGDSDGRIVTWNAASEERLGEAKAGSGVCALAVLDGGRFVAGTDGGDVVFYTHHGGRRMTKAARILGAHSSTISDFSVCGQRLATVSYDNTAAVWSVDSREPLARLSGHTESVRSVDMNERLVATASWDHSMRVYKVAEGYSLITVLDWVHTRWVNSVAFIGDDYILSAGDQAVCITQLSSNTVITRTRLCYRAFSAVALPGGCLFVCGLSGNASRIDAPAAAAAIFNGQDAAAFTESLTVASTIAVEPLPPLQNAVVRVAAGDLRASAACRELICADACSVSLAEWNAAHLLLMRAVRDGGIQGSRTFNDNRNYWFENLYVPSRKLCLGAEDYNLVKRQLEQAKVAGVIETVEATLAAIHAYLDLQDGVKEIRGACEQILCAVSFLFFEQVQLDRRLSSIAAEIHGVKRAQLISSLGNAVFGLIPFAGAALAGSFAGAALLLEASDSGSAVESLLGVTAFPAQTLVDRFLSGGRLVLKAEVLAQMTVEQRRVLEYAAAGLGMSIDDLRRIIVEAIGDVDTTLNDDIVVKDVAEQFGSVILSENPSPSVNNALSDVISSRPAPGEATESALRSESHGNKDEDLVGQTFRDGELQLRTLREQGVYSHNVSQMSYGELATCIAGFLVEYHEMRRHQFDELQRCLGLLFLENGMSGSHLVGNHAVSSQDFFEFVVDGLRADHKCGPTIAYKSSLRRFLALLETG
jgi:WD domain, G-beta repeat